MKSYMPGASVKSDYASVCDNCKSQDGRATLDWDNFSLCLQCIGNIYHKHVHKIDKETERISIRRGIISESLRNEVFDRDGNKCLLCGVTKNLTIDHYVPFSRGGRTIIENLKTLCRSCNSKKGAR